MIGLYTKNTPAQRSVGSKIRYTRSWTTFQDSGMCNTRVYPVQHQHVLNTRSPSAPIWLCVRSHQGSSFKKSRVLEVMSSNKQSHYPLALESWSEVSSACLKVLEESGSMLLLMPLVFLKDGQVPRLGYVPDCIRRNFEDSASLSWFNKKNP